MYNEQDPRFTRTRDSENFNGHHVKGYIKIERVGLIKRRVCHIFNVGRKEFPEHEVDLAREWMKAMDRPQEAKK